MKNMQYMYKVQMENKYQYQKDMWHHKYQEKHQ